MALSPGWLFPQDGSFPRMALSYSPTARRAGVHLTHTHMWSLILLFLVFPVQFHLVLVLWLLCYCT